MSAHKAKLVLATLTLEKYRAWLTGQPEGSVVGRTASNRDCSLARFLQAHELQVRVTLTEVRWMGRANDCVPLPSWARAHEDMSTRLTEHLKREEALDILTQIEQGEAHGKMDS